MNSSLGRHKAIEVCSYLVSLSHVTATEVTGQRQRLVMLAVSYQDLAVVLTTATA